MIFNAWLQVFSSKNFADCRLLIGDLLIARPSIGNWRQWIGAVPQGGTHFMLGVLPFIDG
jgi:hypothetical protein